MVTNYSLQDANFLFLSYRRLLVIEGTRDSLLLKVNESDFVVWLKKKKKHKVGKRSKYLRIFNSVYE